MSLQKRNFCKNNNLLPGEFRRYNLMRTTPVHVTMVEKGSGEREMRILRKNRILLLLFIGLELKI